MKKVFQNHSAFCILHSAFLRGFTLVELMIVMSVIAILASMLFSVVIGAKSKARNKQALTQAHSIVVALKAFRMEYGKWPNQTQGTNDTTYFTNNFQVILPLIGQNPRENPRGKVFLTVQATNQIDSVTNFIDPWGVPYVICMDEDMSGGCLINFMNVGYNNNFAVPPTAYFYSATNYPVTNMEAAVASFAGGTNATTASPFLVETWSEPR